MRGEYMGVAIASRHVTVLKIHGLFAQSKEIRLGHGLGRYAGLFLDTPPNRFYTCVIKNADRQNDQDRCCLSLLQNKSVCLQWVADRRFNRVPGNVS